MTETHVNWVVEARRAASNTWITMVNAADDEVAGRACYKDWLTSKARTGSTMKYRLVKRTAVVTDEVIEHD